MKNKYIITEQGRRLLKSWGYGAEFEKREKITERAAAAVMSNFSLYTAGAKAPQKKPSVYPTPRAAILPPFGIATPKQ